MSEELNIEVDQVSWEGKTALHLSARRGNPELFNFFISQGVSTNQIDKNGNTALINAAAGSKENLEKILAHSNNSLHQNQQGKSAITIAIERGKKENFNFLLSSGAKLNTKDTLGNDLMYYVFKSHNSKKKKVTQHFINQLSTKGLNGKKIDENKNTLAHIAIEKQSVFLLEKAIEMGTNINFKNNINLSPLHLAAMKATNKELLDVLLNNGAEKNTRTEFNESPYDLALQNELLNKGNIDLAFLKID